MTAEAALQLEPWMANHIAVSSLPAIPGAGIYFLTKAGEVVYVGKAVCLLRRIYDHMSEGMKDFDGFSYLTCEPSDLNRLEGHYIKLLLPELNACTMSKRLRLERDGLAAYQAWRSRHLGRRQTGHAARFERQDMQRTA